MNKKYLKIADIYKAHSTVAESNFSESALQELYDYETYGIRADLRNNGYAIGKKFLDVTLAAWKEDMQNGDVTKAEILCEYEEDSFEYEFYSNIMENWCSGTFFPYVSGSNTVAK